ncbi:hypothetical protein AVEN_127523-1 [Araneus ventricosus]|uniref:Uncharacterized protein n=1 Tax=Araneus ventricosus TaxID=182803 RepID=A0A4Y2MK54_ARAVE|nr:hypothetical protein AVEN_127523-1 [Araneus ventricosus]
MTRNKMSPDELKQHFLFLTSLREKKALVDSLRKKLKDLEEDNEPPDHIEIKNVIHKCSALPTLEENIRRREVITPVTAIREGRKLAGRYIPKSARCC